MVTFNTGLAKGLKEPCYPFRQTYAFGAPLGGVNADSWNCLPQLWDPVTTLDLSGKTPGCEAIIALLNADSLSPGNYRVAMDWYRARDGELLYSFTYDFGYFTGPQFYLYTFIGYVDWEIIENGDYFVEIAVVGRVNWFTRETFTVTGIPSAPAPGPIPTGPFMQNIGVGLSQVAGWFNAAYAEVQSWVWPFSLLASPLYGLKTTFDWIAFYWGELSTWVSGVTAELRNVLTLSALNQAIAPIVQQLQTILSWFNNLTGQVTQIINTWWTSTMVDVVGLINAAVSGFQSLINQVTSQVNSVQQSVSSILSRLPGIDQVIAWFGSWRAEVISSIISWGALTATQIQSLVDSLIRTYEPLWDGWQDWRAKVTEFFTDPEDWLYKAVDRIIERFW